MRQSIYDLVVQCIVNLKSTPYIGPVKQIILVLNCDFFLIHQFKHVFWLLKEPSRRDSSFEYPHHMFWLRNKKNNFQLSTLIWGPAFTIRNTKNL